MAGPPKRRPVYDEQSRRVNEELLRIQQEDEANRKEFERMQKELHKRREALEALSAGGPPTPPASSVFEFRASGGLPLRSGSTDFVDLRGSVAADHTGFETSRPQSSEAPTVSPARITGYSASIPKRVCGFKVGIPTGTNVIDLTADEEPQTPTPRRSKGRSNLTALSPPESVQSNLGQSGTHSKHASTIRSGKSSARENTATKASSTLEVKREKPSPSKKRKQTIPSDKETQIPFPKLRREQFDRSAILRKSTVTPSPSPLASIQKHDEQIDRILGTWSHTNSSDSDLDVEMLDAPLANGKPHGVVKLKFNAPEVRTHFKTITTPERAASFRDTPRRRLPDLLYEYATSATTSASRNVTQERDEDSFKSPGPRKGGESVSQFKVPANPASGRDSVQPSTPSRRKRRIVNDDNDDEYDPNRATPAPEHLIPSPTIFDSRAKHGSHLEVDGDEAMSMISVRREFSMAADTLQKSLDAADNLFADPPRTQPTRPTFSAPSKKLTLPRGLRGSLAAPTTASDLGSPRRAPKRRHHTIDVSDDEAAECNPSPEAGRNEDTYVRPTVIPKPGKKKSKFASSVADSNSTSHHNGQGPATKRSKTAPSTPPRAKAGSKPSTPGAPRSNRYINIGKRDEPVSPVHSSFFSSISALAKTREKRRSRAEAELKLREHAEKVAEWAAKTEEEHLEELGGRLSPSAGGRRPTESGKAQNVKEVEESVESVGGPMGRSV